MERLPEVITAAAQSHLGILALLSISLSVLAYFFFAKASEKARIGIFVLLFVGVIGFGAAMFRVNADSNASSRQGVDAPASLSAEAMTLLREAAQDPGGTVFFERYGASVDLHTNGKSLFTDKADHRAMATWEAALEELVSAGLLTAPGEQGEIFEMTRKGYEAAERATD